MSCGHPHEVTEGADLGRVRCPSCGVPHERMVQLRAADHEGYAQACECARRGETEAALKALEETLASGYDDFERVDGERALAGLRADPRFADLMRRYRSR